MRRRLALSDEAKSWLVAVGTVAAAIGLLIIAGDLTYWSTRF